MSCSSICESCLQVCAAMWMYVYRNSWLLLFTYCHIKLQLYVNNIFSFSQINPRKEQLWPLFIVWF